LAAFLAVTVACGDFFVGDETLDHVTVTPTSKLLAVGETQQYKALAVDVGGTSTDVTNSATWTSSNTSIATVNGSGLVTAASAGTNNGTTITITAEKDGETDEVPLVVTAAALTSLTLGPNTPIVTRGSTLQLSATGTLEDSSTVDLTDAVSWTSDDTNAATVDDTGLLTAQSTGTALTVKITATIATKTGSESQNVQVTIQ
jgi:uncharacterized protein YjdB